VTRRRRERRRRERRGRAIIGRRIEASIGSRRPVRARNGDPSRLRPRCDGSRSRAAHSARPRAARRSHGRAARQLDLAAYALRALGRFDEALPVAAANAQLSTAVRGAESGGTLAAMESHADTLTMVGWAKAMLVRLLAVRTRVSGADHPSTRRGERGARRAGGDGRVKNGLLRSVPRGAGPRRERPFILRRDCQSSCMCVAKGPFNRGRQAKEKRHAAYFSLSRAPGSRECFSGVMSLAVHVSLTKHASDSVHALS